ncbi:MAG: hypothetical protein C3F13_19255 [Anaerolineales bacterium]|nr:MAG: hypothetical protein C3F13_19255 [Anaerolineales bacterium]
MQRLGQFLSFFVPMLVLVTLALVVYMFPSSMNASAESQQNQDDQELFLPLVLNKPWPSECYAPGTEYYQPPSMEIPNISLQQGTTITVTNNADIINGNVSSVDDLLVNPGPDGIALREAIEATNNDPGEYTILFAAHLDGTTIYTGGTNNQDLPPLLGGSLIINGDIDGDLVPDITIANASTFSYPFGFKVQSSYNTLHALKIEGYFTGVMIKPTNTTTTDTTFRGITVSNLLISDVLVGINLHAGPDEGARASGNHWKDILLINNDLDVEQDGITFHLNHTIGDHVDNVTIADNSIHVSQNINSASFGIQLMAGFWVGSNNNLVTNITLTHNIILGNPDQGIVLMAGAVGASGNVIDGAVIRDNEILISETNWAYEAGKLGIDLITGDAATDYIDPGYEPIIYPEYNVIRNVDIIGNRIEGFDGRGIQMMGGCCGARYNTIENVNILNNRFATLIPDVSYDVTGILVRSGDARADHPTSENLVSNVIIQDNTFSLGKRYILPDTHFTAAAISVSGAGGGPGADRNQIRDIWISLNRIDSIVPGVHLIGAWENSTQNVVSTMNIYCNTIASAPIYPVFEPPLKGIVLTGAIRNSSLNRVENISLFHNNVAGIWNDLTVIPNVESSAINNIVTYTIYP